MEVRSHTTIKHRTIGYYFRFCRDVMQSKGRSLYYVDLYSGDGVCECSEAPMTIWDPPYLKMLEEAKKRELKLKCVFNDNDKNKIVMLRNRLRRYENFVMGIYHEDANKVYRKILNQIPPSEWSIFSLDPFKHGQLDFTTIEGIASHISYDSKIQSERKPELMITFMVYSILQAYKLTKSDSVSKNKRENILNSIDRCLGTDSWREKVFTLENTEASDIKMNQIFLKVFLNQLEDLGYDTVSFRVEQTVHRNIIYYLIFATSIPGAYKILSQKFEPCVRSLQKDEWIKQNFNFYKMAKAKKEGFALLDEFV